MKPYRSIWIQAIACLGLSTFTTAAAVFSVTNNFDSGNGSLRAAISNANATAGLDTITFAINTNTAGVKTITLSSALPTITEPVVIDGATQPGYSNAPLIEINGNFQAGAHGLFITGGGSTVRALSIRNCGTSSSAATRASGILISSNGGNVVAGCFLGLNPTGLSALQNTADGITINNSPNNVIGGTNAADRNVIGGNSQNGIQIFGPGSTNNRVMGNLIGLSVPGTNAVANFSAGIFLTNVTGNIIGGTNAGTRNIIARNFTVEILVQNSSGVTIAGNYVGLKPDGTVLSTNLASDNGISINNSSNNIVGGLVPAARNVVGNLQTGISMFGSNSVGNIVIGNFIGVGPSGTNTVPNSFGVNVSSGAQSNRIGGTVGGSRNIISANRSYGVYLSSSNNLVQGNFIGLDVTGQRAPLPLQSSGAGIDILASGNVIGGTDAAARNVISGNRGDGIQAGSFSAVIGGIVIQGNFIGTDAGGTLAVSNRNNGVSVLLNTTNCLIGGTNAGEGNVISGNGENGIWLGGFSPVSGVKVFGNRIGFSADLTAPSPSGPSLARKPKKRPQPGAPFLFPQLNGQHGVRCEHADNCLIGDPNGINFIGCGDGGDAITILDGTQDCLVHNAFANYGPFGTIDLNGNGGPSPNHPAGPGSGANLSLNYPIVESVTAQGSTVHVSLVYTGTPNATVTIYLFENLGVPGLPPLSRPVGDPMMVTLDINGIGHVVFDRPYDPTVSFTAMAKDTVNNTSELPNLFPFVGTTGTAALRLGPPPISSGVPLDGPSMFPAPFTVVGPATANDVKFNFTLNPGSIGTFFTSLPFTKTANGIEVSLGNLPPGDYPGPEITITAPPPILGNGALRLFVQDPLNPVQFVDTPISDTQVSDEYFQMFIQAAGFDGFGGPNDVVTMDGVTGNTFVTLNPAGASPSIKTIPLETYCRQHNMRPTSLAVFRGPSGVNHFAATLVSWPWDAAPTGELVVFINVGDGVFGTPMRIFPASPGATGLINGDFNNDGVDDLAYVDSQTGNVAVTRNDGANFFLTPSLRATGGFVPVSVAVGDVNDDGNLDAVVLDPGDGQQGNQSLVSILLGQGNGTLLPPNQILPVPNFGLNIVGGLENSAAPPQLRKVVDFNGDDLPDFAVTSTRGGFDSIGLNAPSVTLILNRPDAPGNFQAAPPISLPDVFLPFGGSRVAAGDVNGDGRTDLVLAEEGSGYASILYNNGPPGYPVPTFGQTGFPIGGANCAVAVSDFNGDGSPDLVVGSSAQVGFQIKSTFTVDGNVIQGDTINVIQPVIAANNPVIGPLLVNRGFGVVDSPSGFNTSVEFSPTLSSFNPLPNVATIGNRNYFPLGISSGVPNRFFRANSQPPVP